MDIVSTAFLGPNHISSIYFLFSLFPASISVLYQAQSENLHVRCCYPHIDVHSSSPVAEFNTSLVVLTSKYIIANHSCSHTESHVAKSLILSPTNRTTDRLSAIMHYHYRPATVILSQRRPVSMNSATFQTKSMYS